MALPSVLTVNGPTTKEQILEVARRRFAEHGYAGTSLNDIADEVGIRRPSLLHHFPSKEALYREVLLDVVRRLDRTRRAGDDGTARRLAAGRAGAARRVHVLRGASRLRAPRALGSARRRADPARRARGAAQPLFDRGAEFLEREMDAGRLRRYDARQLLLTGYGAVLSYLSDAPLMTGLLDVDPLSPRSARGRREHVIDVLRTAVALDALGRSVELRTASAPASVRAAPRRRTPRARPAGRGPREQQEVGRGPARRDVALRVLVGHDEAVGTEAHEPFAVAVGAVKVHRLAVPRTRRRRGQNGRMSKSSSMPSTASVVLDRLRIARRGCASQRCTQSRWPGAAPRTAVWSGVHDQTGARPAGRERVGEQPDDPRRTSRSRVAGGRFERRDQCSVGRRRPLATISRDPAVQPADVRDEVGDRPARARRHGASIRRRTRRGSARRHRRVRIAAMYSAYSISAIYLVAVEQLRAVVVGLVHERRTGQRSSSSSAPARAAAQRVDVVVSRSSHVSHADSGSTTGMRSWIGCKSSFGSVVMIVHDRMRGASSPIVGSCQISHSPANASGSPSRRRMNHGCFCLLALELLPLVEAVGRHDAAAPLERTLVRVARQDRLGAGVDHAGRRP